MKHKIYTIPLLEQKILFIYCNGNEELQKLQQKKKIKEYLRKNSIGLLKIGYAVGTCFSIIENNKPVAIYVSSKLKAYDLEETISHEIEHLVYYLKQMYNFKEENEFNAYINGRINADFRKFIKGIK